MNVIEAITNGLDEAMDNNKDVFMMGEDIGAFEGAFKATKGLHEKYGAKAEKELKLEYIDVDSFIHKIISWLIDQNLLELEIRSDN